MGIERFSILTPHLFQLFRGKRGPLDVPELVDDAFDGGVLEVGGVVLTGLLSVLQGVGRHLQILVQLRRKTRMDGCTG